MNVQKDGINLVGMTKLRSNPENNIGLLTYAKYVFDKLQFTVPLSHMPNTTRACLQFRRSAGHSDQ